MEPSILKILITLKAKSKASIFLRMLTVDVVGLYPSIPHMADLSALGESLGKRTRKEMPTENLIKMAEFVSKNNFFEFDTIVYQQISGTAIGAKFAPPYACIFTDQLETKT